MINFLFLICIFNFNFLNANYWRFTNLCRTATVFKNSPRFFSNIKNLEKVTDDQKRFLEFLDTNKVYKGGENTVVLRKDNPEYWQFKSFSKDEQQEIKNKYNIYVIDPYFTYGVEKK
ncbi:hypothetical protein M1446_03275 [Candidatus Dependentiae bacterium]|nr:hypothetical protein [Candidatus Dependentiae bacterium]